MEINENNETVKKVHDFIDIVARFSEVLDAENAALRKLDTDMVEKLYENKIKLVSSYRNLTAYLIKNRDSLKELPEETRNNLKDLSLALEEKLKENDILLKTRMETSQNVLDTIIRIAKATNNSRSTSYGASGAYSPLDNNHNALAINRTL